MRHLSPIQLAQLMAMLPPTSQFVLVVASPLGVSINSTITDPEKMRAFLAKTAMVMEPSVPINKNKPGETDASKAE